MEYFRKGEIDRMGNLFSRLGRLSGLIVGVFLLLSCSQESVELKNTVTAYNKMLAEALAKPDPGVMEYFATSYERSRIDAYIIYLKKDKKVLVGELKSLEFLGVKVSKDGKSSTVETKELWTFRYVDDTSRKPISGEENITYENTYRLVKEEGRWLVNRVDAREKGVEGLMK